MGRMLSFLLFVTMALSACTVASDDELASRRVEVTEFFDAIEWPAGYTATGTRIVRDPDRSTLTRQSGSIDLIFERQDQTRVEIRHEFDAVLTATGFVRERHKPCLSTGELEVTYRAEAGQLRVLYDPQLSSDVMITLLWDIGSEDGQGVDEVLEVPLENCDA